MNAEEGPHSMVEEAQQSTSPKHQEDGLESTNNKDNPSALLDQFHMANLMANPANLFSVLFSQQQATPSIASSGSQKTVASSPSFGSNGAFFGEEETEYLVCADLYLNILQL